MSKPTRPPRRDYTITPTGHGATRCTRVTYSQLIGITGKMFPDTDIAFEFDLVASTVTVKDMDSDETLATIEVDE